MDSKGKTKKMLSGGEYVGKDGKHHKWSKIHCLKSPKITDDNWMEYGMPADEETNESKNMNIERRYKHQYYFG